MLALVPNYINTHIPPTSIESDLKSPLEVEQEKSNRWQCGIVH